MTNIYTLTTTTTRVTYPYFGFWKSAKWYIPLFPHQFNQPRVFAQIARRLMRCQHQQVVGAGEQWRGRLGAAQHAGIVAVYGSMWPMH